LLLCWWVPAGPVVAASCAAEYPSMCCSCCTTSWDLDTSGARCIQGNKYCVLVLKRCYSHMVFANMMCQNHKHLISMLFADLE
jgi:hypothetical protein